MQRNCIHTLRFMLLALATVYLSCNKPFDNTLKQDYGEEGGAGKTQRTLVIIVDGAVGLEVQKIQPSFISVLTDNSIYSWNGLTDTHKEDVSNALGWTTLLTGVTSTKHKVTGNDFSGNDLQQYPTVFNRLKTIQPGWRTVAYGASADFINNLATDATEKKSFATDAAVKDAVLDELAGKDGHLVVAEFQDVDKAGMAGSYSATNAGYKAAVLRTDDYIKEIVESLSARPTYALENWMVIVTSNKGSVTASDPVAANLLAYDDSRRNTFFICYAPNLKVSYNPGSLPFSGTTPVYQGSSAAATKAQGSNAGTLLDFGATGSFTIECKVRIPAGNYYYPAFLSKRASFSGGVVGWVLFLEGDYWMINFGQSGLGNRQIRGASISDGKWHTLTVTINQQNTTTRRVETFTDGVYYDGGITDATRNIYSYGNLNTTAPFTIGQLAGDNVTNLTDYNVTDIKIYDTAFGRSYVQSNYCKTGVADDDPYRHRLLAYWSGREIVSSTSGQKVLQASSGKYQEGDPAYPGFTLDKLNLGLSGNYSTNSFVEVVNNICPTPDANSYKVVPNSVDMVSQVLAWMGISTNASWGLDGSTWLTSYMNL